LNEACRHGRRDDLIKEMEAMDTAEGAAPRARDEGLVIQDLPDEMLVYDLERHRAHSLNRTAAWVWRHCDGKTSVAEMAALLHRELDLPRDEELVWLALSRLGRAHLLRERLIPPSKAPAPSRRALMRSLAMAGGLALVTSIVAPEAHAAGSLCTALHACVTGFCCLTMNKCVDNCATDCADCADPSTCCA
jgi:coenzyme PQQ synthesis protein D (PqqD)